MKALLMGLAVTAGSCVASLVSLGVIAGATSMLGAGAVGPVVLFVIALEALFFFGGSGLLFRYAGKTLSGTARWAVPVSHAVLQLALFGMFALGSLVAFNR